MRPAYKIEAHSSSVPNIWAQLLILFSSCVLSLNCSLVALILCHKALRTLKIETEIQISLNLMHMKANIRVSGAPNTLPVKTGLGRPQKNWADLLSFHPVSAK